METKRNKGKCGKATQKLMDYNKETTEQSGVKLSLTEANGRQ